MKPGQSRSQDYAILFSATFVEGCHDHVPYSNYCEHRVQLTISREARLDSGTTAFRRLALMAGACFVLCWDLSAVVCFGAIGGGV